MSPHRWDLGHLSELWQGRDSSWNARELRPGKPRALPAAGLFTCFKFASFFDCDPDRGTGSTHSSTVVLQAPAAFSSLKCARGRGRLVARIYCPKIALRMQLTRVDAVCWLWWGSIRPRTRVSAPGPRLRLNPTNLTARSGPLDRNEVSSGPQHLFWRVPGGQSGVRVTCGCSATIHWKKITDPFAALSVWGSCVRLHV